MGLGVPLVEGAGELVMELDGEGDGEGVAALVPCAKISKTARVNPIAKGFIKLSLHQSLFSL